MKTKKQTDKKCNTHWQKLKSIFFKASDASLNLLFPKHLKCIFCGCDIPDFENKPFCSSCEKQGIFNNGHRCKFCDNPLHSEEEVCENCKKHKHHFQKAFCPFLYNDTVKPAIIRFKDDFGKYLAPTFAKYIVEEIKQADVSIDLIIPVPVHKKTLKRRGYNQAEILAQEISKAINAPVDTTSVVKIKYVKQQKKLSYKQRQQNLFSTFLLTSKTNLKDKNVLIVDDIMTTGATVNAISSLIKKYTHNIYVATIARRDILDSKKHNETIINTPL